MSLGQRLLNLRKSKGLSQEELAEKLDVTRQTISKWETDQSLPDFDKIIPICKLYNISADELITGEKEKIVNLEEPNLINKKKKAKGIALGILLYFISVVVVMICIPVFNFDPIVTVSAFLIICGIATFFIVYSCIVYKEEKKEEKENKLRNQIENVLSTFTLIFYLFVSFKTMAWHITWIIWIIFGLVCEILKLIFMLRGKKYEK